MALGRVVITQGEPTTVTLALNRQAAKHNLRPLPPRGCVQQQAWRPGSDAQHLTARWRCSQPIAHLRFSTSGVYEGTVLVRLQGATDATERISRAGRPIDFNAEASANATQKGHFVAGMTHLLGGWDHLLFIALIGLLVVPVRRLLSATLAFTAGHAISLGLAAVGLINLPLAAVEVCIALSLLLMAQLSLRRQDSPPSLVLLGAFGLLHGLGLASGFAGSGLSGWALIAAVLAFNLGVELAQLMWLTVVVLAARGLPRPDPHGHTAIVYTVGTLAAFWLIERATELGSV